VTSVIGKDKIDLSH